MIADIIFFAVVAAFIAFRLYNALGNKDYDPDNNVKNAPVNTSGNRENTPSGKVITLDKEDVIDVDKELEKQYGKELTVKIKEITKIDRSFTPQSFVRGAKAAFEIIITSYSKGDKETLSGLLSKDIYNAFENEIDRLQKNNYTSHVIIAALKEPVIKKIELKRKIAEITVEIVSEQISLVKDDKGEVVDGNPSQADEITDMWTFSRDLTSGNPNWELIDTGE